MSYSSDTRDEHVHGGGEDAGGRVAMSDMSVSGMLKGVPSVIKTWNGSGCGPILIQMDQSSP